MGKGQSRGDWTETGQGDEVGIEGKSRHNHRVETRKGRRQSGQGFRVSDQRWWDRCVEKVFLTGMYTEVVVGAQFGGHSRLRESKFPLVHKIWNSYCDSYYRGM